MKTFASKTRLLVAVAATLLAGGAALAQIPAAGSATGINTAFLKLFGNISTYTARVEVQVFDAMQKQTVRMPMNWAALDGKVRLEVNLEEMTSQEMTPGTIAGLKQSGMSRVVSVFRPDKRASYVICPGIQSYLSVPMAEGEAEAAQKGLTVEKSPLGKETVDGHACVKDKVVVKGSKGPVIEAVTWKAADLKDFPIQIEMKEKKNTVRMRFTGVRFDKPDAKQFDLPTNYGRMK